MSGSENMPFGVGWVVYSVKEGLMLSYGVSELMPFSLFLNSVFTPRVPVPQLGNENRYTVPISATCLSPNTHTHTYTHAMMNA